MQSELERCMVCAWPPIHKEGLCRKCYYNAVNTGLAEAPMCTECDLLLPIGSPGGRCDHCEFLAKQAEEPELPIDNVGVKYDDGKLRWDLLPLETISFIVDVLTHGAQKYKPHDWKNVESFEDRYFAAMMRHLVAHRGGEKRDPDSNMLHLAHAATNIMFLLWKETQDE